MKIKNIVQIATLTGLFATGSTYSMQAMLARSTKAFLQKTGTFLGVGAPTIPLVLPHIVAGYSAYADPITHCSTMHPVALQSFPSEHEKFYRTIVGNEPELRYRPNVILESYNCGNLIVMPEKMYTQEGLLTLDQALASQNPQSLAAFKGLIEHENQHRKEKHLYKDAAVKTLIPTVITTLTGLCFKKLCPMSITLIQHTGRCLIKALGGQQLYTINKNAIKMYTDHANHKREYQADQGISYENREPLMHAIDTHYKVGFSNHVQKEYPHLSELEQVAKVAQFQSNFDASDSFSHPSPSKRRKALLGKEQYT